MERSAHLHTGLRQLGVLGQLLAGVDVGVVGSLEGPLQLNQLLSRKGGAAPPLLPLQGQAGLRLHLRAILRVARWGGMGGVRTKLKASWEESKPNS